MAALGSLAPFSRGPAASRARNSVTRCVEWPATQKLHGIRQYRGVQTTCASQNFSSSILKQNVELLRGSPLRATGYSVLPVYGTRRVYPTGSAFPLLFEGLNSSELKLGYADGGTGNFGGGSGGGGGDRWRGKGDGDEDGFSEFFSWLSETFLSVLRSVVSAYSAFSQQFPMISSGMMTALAMSVAECITQLAIMRQPELNTEPLLRVIIYGCFVKGPLVNIFYGALNKAFTSRKGWNLVKLMILDCGIGSFGFTSVYAFMMPLLKGSSVPEAVQNVKGNVVDLWKIGLKFWPAAMALNYLLLPPSLQVPYILAVDVGYNIALGLQSSHVVDSVKIEESMAAGQTITSDSIEMVDVMVDVPLADAIQALEEHFGSDVELAPSLA